MVFNTKKIPKHLIIQDEYEIRQRSRFGFFKMLMLLIVVTSLTLLVSMALIVI